MAQTELIQELSPPPIVKYLHVISSLNPVGGGPAEGVRQLSRAAIGLGHEVEVVTLDPPDATWARDFPCPVHQLGPGRFGKYRYAPELGEWLRKNAHRFEAVVVNGLWQYHGLAVRNALHGTGTPYFVFTHGMLDPWFKRKYPLKHLKKWLYWPWAEYRILRDARAVLFTCEEERQQARKSFGLYSARELVVSYGTPGPTGDKTAQRNAFLKEYPGLAGKRVLLFLGRIHPKKGCDLLVEAFSRIAARHPALQLVIAGPDPDNWRGALEQPLAKAGLSDRVTWTGMLTGDRKWGALHAAESFILPSHQENFGIAVAEALACGVPVLISNRVNIWREIEADEAGFVGEDTLEGTVDLLQTWLALSSFEHDRMSRSAQSCFRKRFQIESAARSLVAAIREAAVVEARKSVA